jgi:tetratricopeptide (TPR) repeat protein
MNLKEIIEIFENTKIFEIPNTLPKDKKEIYPYAKFCAKNPIISVIGSYSAGKSSFINTLCKNDILPTDTSKTTSIPTFISKGNNKIIIAKINDKHKILKVLELNIDYLETIKQLKKHNLGNNENYRKYIDFIVINYQGFPYENITLIDTPGYSGGDEDYEISKFIINISDGIIFLFSAEKGSLSDDDLEILEYAKNQKVDILVIANKIDRNWEERRKILNYVKETLKQREIEIDDKNVCYFSNDEKYEREVKFELVHIIQEFIKNVAESKKQNYKLIEMNPEYWNNKGNEELRNKKPQEALKCFDKAIELEPNNPIYWDNKGVALYYLKRYEEAIECYDKAIELNPNEPIYWNNKCNDLYYLKRYEEAIECYDRAIKLNPNEPIYWNKKAEVLEELGRYEEAIECYDKAIKLNPNEPRYWSIKGFDLYLLERYEEAIECYDRAIELNPNDPLYWYNKGYALRKLKRYEEAIQCYDRAIELEPNEPIYWSNKAEVLEELGRYEEAIECYDRAIELNPNSPIYWNNKAVVLEELGRYEEAKKCYQKVRELGYKFGYK